ncbi:VOC family protein [Arhodomonas sp. AD133]|uniref:VOC family protein n=1 Tax=Arhodomonas sp. AD133 TaxID=3415009 RepID=UPI003EB941C2
MERCVFDHLVVTAPALEVGADFVERLLGVAPEAGGEHPRMGTHNLLWRLDGLTFLEVIAPDPRAPAPTRARWFGLDGLDPAASPTLSAWVARTSDIHAAAARSPEELGAVEPITRGALEWLITVADDGALPLGGAAPVLIEWQTPDHPASKLPDRGLSLASLEIFHPQPGRVEQVITALDVAAPCSVVRASAGRGVELVAHIDTPRGRAVLATASPSTSNNE